VNAATRPFDSTDRWVTFALEGQRLALPLASVIRFVRAAEITPLPLAPGAVAGAIDVGGRILPVFDLRQRLRLPPRELRLTDQFAIARTASRVVALIVDTALGLVDAAPAGTPGMLAPGLRHLRGVLSLPDGLVLIQDLEDFLSPDEDAALTSALRAEEARRAR
jgi:purine-binding chemotaxis protein CheW